MTINEEQIRYPYVGDDVTDEWIFGFSYNELTDITLYVDVGGAGETLIDPANYTIVELGGKVGGHILYPKTGTKLTPLDKVAVLRDTPNKNTFDFKSQVRVAPADIESSDDDKARQLQELADLAGRAVKIPVTSTDDPDDLLQSIYDAEATAVAAAATATTQAGIATSEASDSADSATASDLSRVYSSNWAINPEDTPVSIAAGGDGSTTFSSLHWAAKAAAIVAGIPDLETQNVDYDPSQTIGTLTHILSLQVALDHMWTAGCVDGGLLVDNTDGTIKIETAEIMVRSSADGHAPLYVAKLAEHAVLALADNADNFVYLDYNSGTPQYVASTNEDNINGYDKVLIHKVFREGTDLYLIDCRNTNVDLGRHMDHFLRDTQKYHHKGGTTAISEPAALALALTAGEFYYRTIDIPHPAFDTNVAGTANENVFRHWSVNSSVWTGTVDQKLIDTTLYNDVAAGMVAMGTSKWSKSWLYVVNNAPSSFHVLAGQGEFNSQAAAEADAPPSSVPPIIAANGVLVGAVIYQKSVTTFDDILSAFTTIFNPSQAQTHDELAGISGLGNYHLSEQQAKIHTQGANIATAATVNLDNATGDKVNLTGTTTVTAITLAEGYERTCVATGIFQLTYGASLLNLTAGNITTAVGDIMVFRGEAAGVVRMVSYERVDGTALSAAPADVYGGATIVSQGTSLTLTAGSTKVQDITFTAADLFATLPDATTLSEGGEIFVISNDGANSFLIKDDDGIPLCNLKEGQTVSLYLVDNSTAGGSWRLTSDSFTSLDSFIQGIEDVGAVKHAGFQMVEVDDDKVMLLYAAITTNYPTAVIFSISGTSVTRNTPTTIEAAAVAGYPTRGVKLTATEILVQFATGASVYAHMVLSVSGVSITTNTKQALNPVSISSYTSLPLVRLSATRVACFYEASGFSCKVLNISGVAITNGANQASGYSMVDFLAVSEYDTDKVLLVVSYSTQTRYYPVTFSGDVMTYAYTTSVRSASTISYQNSILKKLDTNKLLFVYESTIEPSAGFTKGLRAQVLTMSPTEDAIGYEVVHDLLPLDVAVQLGNTTYNEQNALQIINPNEAILSLNGGTSGGGINSLIKLNINDLMVKIDSIETVSDTFETTAGSTLVHLGGNKYMVGWVTPAANYFSAVKVFYNVKGKK